MPDVTPCLHPGEVRRWISFDQHKFSIVAGVLPPDGGKPEVCRIETTERAIRRFIEKQGGPEGLSVCYEAGPGGFALWRLLTRLGVACDVVAPSLIPVRAGDRVKTDRRDAKKLVSLYRAGMLRFVHPPTPELEGLRDLLRARDDLRGARLAARNRVLKQLLRHGRIFREGKTAWTKLHRAWLAQQRLDDPLAQEALEQLLIHVDGIERQLDTLDARLAEIAGSERWAGQVQILTRFRGIATITALGLIAEIGDFARFSHPRGACRLARDRPVGVLLRRSAASRAHHPVREQARSPAAGRSCVALVRHEALCCIPGAAGTKLEGRFVGLMAYPDPRGERDNRMPAKRWSVQVSGPGCRGTRVIWRKLDCLNPNLQMMQRLVRRKDIRYRRHALRRLGSAAIATFGAWSVAQ